MKETLSQYPDLSDIKKAHAKISGLIKNTPVMTSSAINAITGAELYFKCENFQKAGAFKFRGASHALMTLDKSDLERGVATHSSGNHAGALALAAQMHDIPAYIVMPETAPEVKVKAVKGYGAHIIFCKPTLEARESTLNSVIKETGATFIHPYNNLQVIKGQGTAALELLEEVKCLTTLMSPVGGGGLLSGTVLASKGVDSTLEVVASEPEGADDAYRSMREGKFIPSVNPNTIADGLLTSLGSITYPIIRDLVDGIFTVSETSIVAGMRLLWERMKIVVEPSSATTLGAVLQHNQFFRGKRIGIILSGGNVDLDKLPFNT